MNQKYALEKQERKKLRANIMDITKLINNKKVECSRKKGKPIKQDEFRKESRRAIDLYNKQLESGDCYFSRDSINPVDNLFELLYKCPLSIAEGENCENGNFLNCKDYQKRIFRYITQKTGDIPETIETLTLVNKFLKKDFQGKKELEKRVKNLIKELTIGIGIRMKECESNESGEEKYMLDNYKGKIEDLTKGCENVINNKDNCYFLQETNGLNFSKWNSIRCSNEVTIDSPYCFGDSEEAIKCPIFYKKVEEYLKEVVQSSQRAK
ncbi:MAG: hypothetical protein ACOC1P_00575 [Minisyncoccales bacterium]